ncbi:MAG: serine hydrolase [Candidatus Aminicenantes bacterium]
MRNSNRFSRYAAVLVLTGLTFFTACGGRLEVHHFPGETWTVAENPEDFGYSTEALKAAESYTQFIDTAAVVIVVNGVIVHEWGEVERKFMTHSTRKSFLSALYGNHVGNGTIDLNWTMEEIGINDEPPLSETELQATIRDCIKSRSGIYHTALYESASMKELKPERHTQRPGTHWYYNNWDFNALGTIFTKFTGKDVFEAMAKEIAEPIGMEDFTAGDGEYVTGEESIHPAYPFVITARDMARFGLLMLRRGKWNNTQIVPEEWVKKSTRYHSDAALYGTDGYGYMWWVVRHHNRYLHLPNVELPEGSYSARGAGGHYILIIPRRDMVIVHRVNTFDRNRVSSGEFGTLVKMILDAKKK